MPRTFQLLSSLQPSCLLHLVKFLLSGFTLQTLSAPFILLLFIHLLWQVLSGLLHPNWDYCLLGFPLQCALEMIMYISADIQLQLLSALSVQLIFQLHSAFTFYTETSTPFKNIFWIFVFRRPLSTAKFQSQARVNLFLEHATSSRFYIWNL